MDDKLLLKIVEELGCYEMAIPVKFIALRIGKSQTETEQCLAELVKQDVVRLEYLEGRVAVRLMPKRSWSERWQRTKIFLNRLKVLF